MVGHLFSQGGASLTLGYFILPFQGNASGVAHLDPQGSRWVLKTHE